VWFHVQALATGILSALPPLDYAKVKSCDGDDAAPHHYTTTPPALDTRCMWGFKTFQCCHWSHSEKEELDDSKVCTRNSSANRSSSPQSYSILLRKAHSTPASPSRSRYRSHRYCSPPAAPRMACTHIPASAPAARGSPRWCSRH